MVDAFPSIVKNGSNLKYKSLFLKVISKNYKKLFPPIVSKNKPIIKTRTRLSISENSSIETNITRKTR